MFDSAEVRDRFNGICFGCQCCDGRACAGKVPGMGGITNGRCFRSNVEALSKVLVRPRFIHDIEEVSTEIDLFGLHLKFPVIGAPIAGMWRNLPDIISEQALISAFVDGARGANTVTMTGGGLMPSKEPIEGLAFEMVKELGGGKNFIPILKPHSDDALLIRFISTARDLGCRAVGVDIDSMLSLAKWNGSKSRGVNSWHKIVASADIPVIFKGIMTTEDARAAVDAGASAIVVSNHGGRVLDDMPSTAEVLPGIASAVADEIVVMADGGIRTGADVFKMLALGAKAVLVGRPLIIGAVMRGSEGVQITLEALRDELIEVMRMTGTADISGVTRELVSTSLVP